MTSSSAPADRLAGALVLALALLSLPRSARGHDESLSSSEVVVERDRLLWTVEVGVAGLDKAIPLLREGGAGAGALVTEADLQARRPAIVAYLARAVTVTFDGRPATAEVGALLPRHEVPPGAGAPTIDRVALELRFRAPREITALTATVALFADLTSQHRAILRVRWGDEVRQIALLGPRELVLEKGKLQPSPARQFSEFLLWGGHHILVGLDHLAFLLALLLAIVRVRQLLLVITSFTLAHSITIFLSASGQLRFPPAITEALIAASIVYLAAENLLLAARAGDRGGRWLVAFAFGLVHGLGFAEVLRERLAESPGALVLPVLAFNLGVELGQVAVVAVVFPLLSWLRRRGPQSSLETRQKQILRWGSGPLLLLGLIWFFQRLG